MIAASGRAFSKSVVIVASNRAIRLESCDSTRICGLEVRKCAKWHRIAWISRTRERNVKGKTCEFAARVGIRSGISGIFHKCGVGCKNFDCLFSFGEKFGKKSAMVRFNEQKKAGRIMVQSNNVLRGKNGRAILMQSHVVREQAGNVKRKRFSFVVSIMAFLCDTFFFKCSRIYLGRECVFFMLYVGFSVS